MQIFLTQFILIKFKPSRTINRILDENQSLTKLDE
jgi:hypothetical protein